MRKTLLVIALGLTTAFAHASYEYVWSGGEPGYSGQVFLDAPSSPLGGGSLSDVISATVTDPQGAFVLDPTQLGVGFGGPFTWNPSMITSMNIEWDFSAQYGGVAAIVENYDGEGVNFMGSAEDNGVFDIDSSGSWLAATVPDASSTLSLAGMAVGGLTWLHRKK